MAKLDEVLRTGSKLRNRRRDVVVAFLTLILAGLPSLAAGAYTPFDVYINFQPSTSAIPAGYIADTGLAFDSSRGFGWVRQDSLGNATATPLDVTKNARDRARTGIDPRLNTLIHMQLPSTSTGVHIPAAWQYALPNGVYSVTVSVGDQPPYDSVHVIRVEGQTVIDSFQSTSSQEFVQATAEVTVDDGILT